MSVTQSEFSPPGAVSKELFPVRPACVTRLLLSLLLLALPAVVQAQFDYTTNSENENIAGNIAKAGTIIEFCIIK